MTKLYNGGYTYPNGISVAAGKPLDDRLVLNSVEDLYINNSTRNAGTAVLNKIAYTGMPVIIANNDNPYVVLLKNSEPYENGSTTEVNASNYTTYWTIPGKSVEDYISGTIDSSINKLETEIIQHGSRITGLEAKAAAAEQRIGALENPTPPDYVEMIIEADAARHYKLFYDVRCIGWLEIDGEEVELPVITENRAANYFAALSTGRHVVHFKPKEGYMSEKPDTPWKEREALLGWCDDNRVTEVTLPEGWTVVNSKMFEGANSLRRVNLPSTITEVRFGGFIGCTALEEIVLPPAVTKINTKMAENCTALKRIVLGGSNISVSGTLAKNCPVLECVEFREGGTVAFTGTDNTFISLPHLARFIVKDKFPTFEESITQPFTSSGNVGSSVEANKRWLFTPDGGEDTLVGKKWRDLIRYCGFTVTKALSYTLL